MHVMMWLKAVLSWTDTLFLRNVRSFRHTTSETTRASWCLLLTCMHSSTRATQDQGGSFHGKSRTTRWRSADAPRVSPSIKRSKYLCIFWMSAYVCSDLHYARIEQNINDALFQQPTTNTTQQCGRRPWCYLPNCFSEMGFILPLMKPISHSQSKLHNAFWSVELSWISLHPNSASCLVVQYTTLFSEESSWLYSSHNIYNIHIIVGQNSHVFIISSLLFDALDVTEIESQNIEKWWDRILKSEINRKEARQETNYIKLINIDDDIWRMCYYSSTLEI
jgi:hypothetical protein